jgi:hypothetical protein
MFHRVLKQYFVVSLTKNVSYGQISIVKGRGIFTYSKFVYSFSAGDIFISGVKMRVSIYCMFF